MLENPTENAKKNRHPRYDKSIVDKFGTTGNLLQIRFVVVCLLGFSGFLRISELLEIRVCDLTFDEECLKVLIPKSKTDQVKEGQTYRSHKYNTRRLLSSELDGILFGNDEPGSGILHFMSHGKKQTWA